MKNSATELRVLIVEDSAPDAELIAEALRKGRWKLTVTTVANLAELRAALTDAAWDVVVCDYRLTDGDGFQVLAILKEHCLTVPFILVSGVLGEDKAVDALHAGVDDYVMKSGLARLVPAVEKCVASGRLRQERDLARTALAESDRRFLELLEGLKGQAFFYLDVEGVIQSWNAGAQRLFGHRTEEALGQPVSMLYTPADVEMGKPFLDLQLGGQAGQYEEEDWRVRKDGSPFWANTILSGQRKSDGTIRGFGVLVRDSTEQRTAAESLKDSAERFRSLVNRIPDSVWTGRANGDLAYASPNISGLTGFSAEEFQEQGGRLWRERLHPKDVEPLQMAWRRLFKERAPLELEVRFQARSGDWRWLLLRAASVYERGDELLADGILSDTSERRRAGQRIQEQARLLDLAKDAIVVRDLAHRITYWNHGAEELFGWPAADAVGRDLVELTVGQPEPFLAAQKVLLESGEWTGELTHCNQAGKDVIVSARWTLVRDASGRPESVLAINSDITDKKRLESQFLRSQRMESIGAMAGGVAHDLNNILAPIMMSAPLLRQDTLSAEERSALVETIERNSQRGGELVRQLLLFGRGIDGERVVVQPRFLIKEMLKIGRETFPRNITFEEAVEEDLWPIVADPTHLHQVLLNLCVNARDAMPQGGVLRIDAANQMLDEHFSALDPEARQGAYISLRVSDTGAGIPREHLEKIFDPFFTTKEVGKGTGLGLSTVMGIVKSLGGVIHVYSEPGKGSCFHVILPASPGELATPAAGQKPLARGRGECVLVVDDEPGVLEATCKMLNKNGYQTLSASDGAEALTVFSRNQDAIHVVLTDVMMPVMDGLALVRVIRKISPDLRIMASSGLGDDSKMAALKTLGVGQCLVKPYTAGKLLGSLRELLDA